MVISIKIKNYRRCISCQKLAPKESFLRIVRVHPSHEILLNQGMGRSAYLCPQVKCLEIAQKKKKIARSLKTNISSELYEKLGNILEQKKDLFSFFSVVSSLLLMMRDF